MLERDEITERARKDLKRTSTFHRALRKEMREAFDFRAGHQWSTDDLAILEEQKRPPVTFNRIGAMIKAISGTQVNNRQEITFRSKKNDDTSRMLSEALNQIGKWARDEQVEEEETVAFEDALTCGIGVTDCTMEYDEDLDGKFTVMREDPLVCRWDVTARRPNLIDARWVGRIKDMDRELFEFLWPDAQGSLSVFGVESDDLVGTTPEREENDYRENPETLSAEVRRVGRIRVFEYQYWDMEDGYRVQHPITKKLEFLTADKFDILKKKFKENGFAMVDINSDPGMKGIRYLRQQKRMYYQAFFSGMELLEHRRCPSRDGFTLKFITGCRDEINWSWFGLYRVMKDPQQWGNKFLSQMIHQYNCNIKGGMLFEEGAIDNPAEFENKLARPNAFLEVKEGTLTGMKYKMLDPAPFPAAAAQIFQIAFDAAPHVTGLNMEFLGMETSQGPIGLAQMRKLATMTILAPYFSSFKHYHVQMGKLLMEYIREYFILDQMEQAVSPELIPILPKLKEIETARFEVVVDDAPLTPSTKASVFQFINQLAQFNPNLAQNLMPALLDYSDLPAKLIDQLKKQMQPDPQAQQMQAQAAQAQMQNVQADTQKLSAQAELAKAKAEEVKPSMDLKEAKLMQDSMAQMNQSAQHASQLQHDATQGRKQRTHELVKHGSSIAADLLAAAQQPSGPAAGSAR